MKTPYIILAFCLGAASAAVGQAPYTRPDMPNMSRNIAPIKPDQLAKLEQAGQLSYAAASDLHLGNYAQAEAEAREALTIDSINGISAEVLAGVLDAQGKDQEALQQYQTVVEHYDKQPRNLLPYAQLLLKSGQWAQALAVYNQALPHLPDVGPHPETPIVHDNDQLTANSHFSPDVPEPAALAVALHIARGLVLNATPSWAGGVPQNTEAMAEYAKALQLAPDNALVNYYYGVGWHKLSPTERVKFGHAAQAKAALQKAVLTGDAGVKQKAEETLKRAN